MLELKVHCDCGQKYKFDVEPVNGQIPFTVACPICHRDGTANANAMLQQMSVFRQVEPPPLARASAVPAPMAPPPSSAPAPIAPPPAASAPARLRVTALAHTESPAIPSPIAPITGTTPPPIGARPRLGVAPSATIEDPAQKPNFWMGLLGGFIGALIGSVIYYFIFKTTGVRIFLALGVGALAGFGANYLGKGEGSNELGGITAVFVVVGILAAQYLVILGLWNGVTRDVADAGYGESIVEAKAIIKAVPTGSDLEIKMYLARQMAEDGEVAKPASVSDAEVKQFREKELPEYQNLASGKVTKEQYLAQSGVDPEKMKKLMNEDGSTFKAFFILYSLNLRAIISMVVGAGLAYKFSTNARGG